MVHLDVKDEETTLLADMRARIDGIKAKIRYHDEEIKQHGEIIDVNTKARDRMLGLLNQYEKAMAVLMFSTPPEE